MSDDYDYDSGPHITNTQLDKLREKAKTAEARVAKLEAQLAAAKAETAKLAALAQAMVDYDRVTLSEIESALKAVTSVIEERQYSGVWRVSSLMDALAEVKP
jgi:multidrug resistance efflux pump